MERGTKLPQFADELEEPTSKVSLWFPEVIEEDHLHIIVQVRRFREFEYLIRCVNLTVTLLLSQLTTPLQPRVRLTSPTA